MGNRRRSGKEKGRGARSRDQSADSVFEQALRDDGQRPKKLFDARVDRKTLQLCRQVQRALMLALSGECGDDLLLDLSVDSVAPVGGAGHLLVRVIVPVGSPVMDVLALLNDQVGRLRAIVAVSICRKRVPMLSFTAVSPTEGEGDA